MRPLLLYLLAVLMSIPSAGQPTANAGPVLNKQLGQLWRELESVSSDTARIRIQLTLANAYLYVGGDSALILLNRAEKLSEKIQYTPGLVEALQMKGTFYEANARDYKQALHYYKKGLAVAISDGLYTDIHDLYGNLLNLYFYLGEFINAMKIASDGLSLSEKHNDAEKRAHYHNIIGFIHLRQKNSTAAEHHYRLYLGFAKQIRDSNSIANAYNGIGEALLMNPDYETALGFLEEAKKIYFHLYSQGRLLKKDRLPYVLFKIGYSYGLQNKLEKALSYTDQVLQYTKVISCNNYDVAQYYIYSGHLYTRLNNFHRGVHLLRTGLGIAIKINHKEDIRDAYLHLHQLFSAKKEYDSAYFYYALYDALKDSIINETTRKEIQQLEANYQLEKKDNEILMLNQQKILQAEKIRKQALVQNLLILFAALVIVTTLLLVNRNHLKRKNPLQQETNARQAEVFSMATAIQDKERKRIAQDLHDGMGTLLSAAKLKLSSLSATTPEVHDTLALLDDATAELRNISHNIMPAALSRLGLVAALKNLFEKLSETKDVSIAFITHGLTDRLPEEKEIFIYRIILELVNNIVKHSQATVATIQLIKHPGHINITVEDNGIGFINHQEHEGIGLSNIRSRVDFLKGNIYIDTVRNEGTTVIIDIPG